MSPTKLKYTLGPPYFQEPQRCAAIARHYREIKYGEVDEVGRNISCPFVSWASAELVSL